MDIPRGLDADSNLVALDVLDSDGDVVADQDGLAVRRVRISMAQFLCDGCDCRPYSGAPLSLPPPSSGIKALTEARRRRTR